MDVGQGWARDLEARDRDETETSGPETETRPRRLIICPRRDEIETLIIRDETETLNTSRDRLETETSRPRRRDRSTAPPWHLTICHLNSEYCVYGNNRVKLVVVVTH